MIVLKFMKTDEKNRHVEVTLSCETVAVIQCDDGFIITAYKSYTHSDGVEYRLCKDTEDICAFRLCFVINPFGKTIGKYTTY